MSGAGSIEIRSYRSVFDLERRIYRIDRLRLNPGGVPLRGVLYCVLIAAVVLVLGRLPAIGSLLALLPWLLRDLALPAAGAALLCVVRIEGRPFHRAAWALVRYAAGPRRLSGLTRQGPPGPGGTWRIPDLLVLCDGSEARLRRVRFTGPGATLIGVAHERESARPRPRPRVLIKSLGTGRALASATVLELAPGVRLEVRGPQRARPWAGGSRPPGGG